jgi:hypothetical protein
MKSGVEILPMEESMKRPLVATLILGRHSSRSVADRKNKRGKIILHCGCGGVFLFIFCILQINSYNQFI